MFVAFGSDLLLGTLWVLAALIGSSLTALLPMFLICGKKPKGGGKAPGTKAGPGQSHTKVAAPKKGKKAGHEMMIEAGKSFMQRFGRDQGTQLREGQIDKEADVEGKMKADQLKQKNLGADQEAMQAVSVQDSKKTTARTQAEPGAGATTAAGAVDKNFIVLFTLGNVLAKLAESGNLKTSADGKTGEWLVPFLKNFFPLYLNPAAYDQIVKGEKGQLPENYAETPGFDDKQYGTAIDGMDAAIAADLWSEDPERRETAKVVIEAWRTKRLLTLKEIQDAITKIGFLADLQIEPLKVALGQFVTEGVLTQEDANNLIALLNKKKDSNDRIALEQLLLLLKGVEGEHTDAGTMTVKFAEPKTTNIEIDIQATSSIKTEKLDPEVLNAIDQLHGLLAKDVYKKDGAEVVGEQMTLVNKECAKDPTIMLSIHVQEQSTKSGVSKTQGAATFADAYGVVKAKQGKTQSTANIQINKNENANKYEGLVATLLADKNLIGNPRKLEALKKLQAAIKDNRNLTIEEVDIIMVMLADDMMVTNDYIEKLLEKMVREKILDVAGKKRVVRAVQPKMTDKGIPLNEFQDIIAENSVAQTQMGPPPTALPPPMGGASQSGGSKVTMEVEIKAEGVVVDSSKSGASAKDPTSGAAGGASESTASGAVKTASGHSISKAKDPSSAASSAVKTASGHSIAKTKDPTSAASSAVKTASGHSLAKTKDPTSSAAVKTASGNSLLKPKDPKSAAPKTASGQSLSKSDESRSAPTKTSASLLKRGSGGIKTVPLGQPLNPQPPVANTPGLGNLGSQRSLYMEPILNKEAVQKKVGEQSLYLAAPKTYKTAP